MNEARKKLIEDIRMCDSLHNNCDYLLEHNDCDLLIDYITQLEQENQILKKENSKLKYLPKQIEKYILSEMYVNREVVAGWLQFDKLLKMIDMVDE